VYKIPISTLVVIYTPELQVLLLERADHPSFWQSVTGSQSEGETLRETAIREVYEETGLKADQYELTDWQKENRYEIYPIWRHRYPPNTTHNIEHVFGLLVPNTNIPIQLSVREHLAYEWVDYENASKRCFSESNRLAIVELPTHMR
jgi:dihydroneopterin triphosphate diphosphatase